MVPAVRQLLIELSGVPPSVLSDADALRDAAVGAAERIGAPILFTWVAATAGCSLTGIAVAEEAYVMIRTWPDEGVASADVMVRHSTDPAPCVNHLLATLRASRHMTLELARGIRISAPGHTPAE